MKSLKGYGFFLAMLLVILVVYISSDFLMNATQKSYTITQFKEDLSAGMIKSVDVIQNPEIPTGEIRARYSIFQVVKWMFLIFHDFQFSCHIPCPTVDISKFSTFFSFPRHISRPKVCISHFL